jgi:hypothetical protein
VISSAIFTSNQISYSAAATISPPSWKIFFERRFPLDALQKNMFAQQFLSQIRIAVNCRLMKRFRFFLSNIDAKDKYSYVLKKYPQQPKYYK